MQLAFDLDLPAEAAPTAKRVRAPAAQVRRHGAEQLDLPGLPPAPVAPLFLAVCPDAHASGEIDRRVMPVIVSGSDPEIRVIPPERRHVSLVGFGRFHEILPRQIVRLDAALRKLDDPVFPASFESLMSFAPSGAIVLTGGRGVAALHDFQGRVCDALNIPRQARSFTPHITLAYGSRTVPRQVVGPVAWRVTELRLIHSLRGPTRHLVKARWPLPV